MPQLNADACHHAATGVNAGAFEPVIIVGAGAAGLGAALELARFGLRSVVVEQRPLPVDHPRTRTFMTQTLEISRGWGQVVYERLLGIDSPPAWKSPIRFLPSMVDAEVGHIDSVGFAGAGPEVSPATAIVSSQELFEQVLTDEARASGLVELRPGHRVEAVVRGTEEDSADTAVRICELESGESYELSGPAVIAADGVDSRVREDLGIELRGEKNLSHFINVYFQSDLESRLGGRAGILWFIANPRAEGVLQPLDARGRWLCQITVPESEWDLELYTPERCVQWIRDASGVPKLDPRIRSVGRWRMHATLADRLVAGRIVLCGDAAHQCPPTGGMGVNTGIRGVHNVVWKLAMFITGRASHDLVKTYEDEHCPVVLRTNHQCHENHRHVKMIARAALDPEYHNEMSPDEIVTASRRYGNQFGIEFGSAYASGAIIQDGTALPVAGDSYSDYVPTGHPGCRAPHIWLGRNGARLSTRDLIGTGFTVIAGSDGRDWETAVVAARDELEVAMTCYVIGRPGLEDSDGLFLERYGLQSDGAVLIRPDGYVAWRSVTGALADSDTIVGVVRTILSASAESASSV
jgi:putative polyketide hydroxylase